MTDSPARRLRHSFHLWRRSRPLWGALLLAWGGYFVIRPVVGSLQFVAGMGTSGLMTYVIGLGMIAAAVTAVVAPAQRHFPAIMAMLLSIVSLPVANLGGWLIGMILGIIGSGLVFAWTPYTDEELAISAAKAERRAERRALKRDRRAGVTA